MEKSPYDVDIQRDIATALLVKLGHRVATVSSGAEAYIKKPYTLEKIGTAVKNELKK